MKNRNGFTLIEILVVVLIIGILAAIAVPQYQIAVGKSKYSTIKGLAKAIANDEEDFYTANGYYTKNLSDLDVQKPNNISCGLFGGQGKNTIKAVECSVYINKIEMRYYYYFNNDQPSGYTGNMRLCLAYTTDKSHITNKICKQETGNAGSCSSTYCTYIY